MSSLPRRCLVLASLGLLVLPSGCDTWLGKTPAAPLPGISVLREVLDHGVRRAGLQRGFLEQLRERHGEPVYELPLLPDGMDVERLADLLERALG